ncbi:threonine synthase 1 [Anaeramoeba flamelloides]|uniref:Threonine synthase 1 n=1 Tax=Anaeramoeba flamelloides TaxID=1746091 RepID=A0AAV7ZFJ2_9EUKA|nr:threonine synthase 1 [Anaeramoeba flamelloides]|eukprot:Anaeramoba_flamelloidesa819606_238.p1 GENE.a819606_238~~a819606_238.p1  ORF type:complete len:442 (-),score=98.91 a819606_238:20-1345(-)
MQLLRNFHTLPKLNHFANGLKSVLTGKKYSFGQFEYTCQEEGNKEGLLDVSYDYDGISKYIKSNGLFDKDSGMYRYRAFLPLPFNAEVPPLLVGNTPLYKLPTYEGFSSVYVKDEGRNPTASLKDRASSLVVAKAIELGKTVVTTASTGNAAAALSGLMASVSTHGLLSNIFVPENIPVAKLAQLLVYGSQVFLVRGTYDDAYDLCMEATHKYKWYSRSTGYNYFTVEGKKTVSFEMCEQLAKFKKVHSKKKLFKSPDSIFVSVGDGNIISGVHKGLKDLYKTGMIEKMPRIFGVQSENSRAMYNCWKYKLDPFNLKPIECNTIADSISANLPRDPIRALRSVTETNGQYMTVSDNEILKAIPDLARVSGVFPEPAASCSWAGFKKAIKSKLISPDETVVVISTGNGLKDIKAAQESVKVGSKLWKVSGFKELDEILKKNL